MKRRGFIRLLGAAVAAPALPMSATALPARASNLAAALARSNRYISATGLSKALDLPLDQGREVLASLSRSGLVGPINTSAMGSFANSNAYQGIIQTTRATKPKRVVQKTKLQARRANAQANASTWLTHLHGLCRDAGLDVHPSARAVSI